MTGADIAALVALLLLAVDLLIRIIAVIIVPRNRRPSTGIAWLMAIFVLPYVGFLLFLLIGSYKLPKGRRDKQYAINEFIIETTEGIERVSDDDPWPPWFKNVVELNRTLGAMPLVGGNQATLVGDYDASIRLMTDEIDKAHRYVHAEFYILSYDQTTKPFFEALAAAVKRGVTVRVLLDHIASVRAPGHKKTVKLLNQMGVKWHFMLPVQPLKGKWQRPDLRNHRKILVVDGDVAFMGSQNVVDRSYNKKGNLKRGLKWQDLMTRLEGPIVAGINAIFITDWYSESNELLLRETRAITDEIIDDEPDALDMQVVPSGPGFEGENNLRLFLALLYAAQERIIITSPYFVPDDAMLYAAQQGFIYNIAYDEPDYPML